MSSIRVQPEILDRAIDYLSRSTAFESAELDWRIVRMERKSTVVFRLTTRRSFPGDPTIYYKVFRGVPARNERDRPHVDSLTNRLGRSQRLTERLIELTRDLAILIAPILTVDPPSGTVVTLGVPGRALGNMATPPPTSGLVEKERQRFELLGELCALIEHASVPEEATIDWVRLQDKAGERIQRSEIGDAKLLADLVERISDLCARTSRETAPVFAHGDLSASNILRSKGLVSVVDFGWVARFPVFDLAVLSYRLRANFRRWPGRRRRFHEALVSGYRSIHEQPRAAWDLTNGLLLARALGSKFPAVRLEGQKAAREFLRSPESGTAEMGPAEVPWWWVTT